MDLDRLKVWFHEAQRDFPWRRLRTPYAVWVSEVMLQQTQASVVVPYFERWMSLFPTIQDLAIAPIDAVIKAWEGLGYYSRARNLHTGAKYIVDNYKGVFPQDPKELAKIKGLGPYTVGAICSFAFQQKIPAVDGNVMRVLARYFLLDDDIAKAKTVQKFRQLTSELLPEIDPWIVSEALIELGATVCTRSPKCHECPLKANCKGFLNGRTHDLPYKSSKTKIENLYRAVAIISHQNKFLIRRAGKGEIMSDLHEFPYFELESLQIKQDELLTKVKMRFNCPNINWKSLLPQEKHSFTRFQVQLQPVHFCMPKKSKPFESKDHLWLTLEELKQLAFSSGHRRILQKLSLTDC